MLSRQIMAGPNGGQPLNDVRISPYAKPVPFFFEFAETPSKNFKKCKIRRINPTAFPSASYVVYLMLCM